MWFKKRRFCGDDIVRVDIINRYNYVLEISYDGSHYFGSQYQPNKITVESDLKKHLIFFFKDIENLIFAGRTDSGVHATGQCLNFFSSYKIDLKKIKAHVNRHSNYIKINSIKRLKEDFHSRKSALKRRYSYLFSNLELPVYLTNYVGHIDINIDDKLIQECLNVLIGEHDFAVFQKTGSSMGSTIRYIYDAKIEKFKYKVLTDSHKSIILNRITIDGNAFLYRMIRNLLGAIFMICSKRNYSTLDFKRLLIQNKRIFNFKPAPAAGLYLNKIWY